MADHIKGSKYESYGIGLQKGILLHRQIDSFTDAHEILDPAKEGLTMIMACTEESLLIFFTTICSQKTGISIQIWH